MVKSKLPKNSEMKFNDENVGELCNNLTDFFIYLFKNGDWIWRQLLIFSKDSNRIISFLAQ